MQITVTLLHTSTEMIDFVTKEFFVETQEAYSIYRIVIERTEPQPTGISHFQIFTKSY